MTALDPSARTWSPVIPVLCLMALSSFSFFLTFPYLTLYISFNFGQSPTQTGAIVGSVTLIASGGAWLGGRLADKVGARRIVLWASLVYTVGYLLLFAVRELVTDVLALVLVGVARMLMEPAIKSLLVRLGGADGRLFRTRYLLLVVAASVAPLCIALVPFERFATVFLAAGGLYAVGGLVALTLLNEHRFERSVDHVSTSQSKLPVPATLTLIVLSGLAFLTVFSQFETILALHLSAERPENGMQIYRFALLANALAALVLVLGIEAAGWDTTQRGWIILGTLSFSAAALCLFVGGDLWVVALGVALFTLGEVLLFPLPDIFAARIAKPGNEGRLMGLVDIRYLGFFIGPTLGGLALTEGPLVLAICLAGLSFLLLPVFLLINMRVR